MKLGAKAVTGSLALASLSLFVAGCGQSSVAAPAHSHKSARTASQTTAVIALPVQNSPNWFFPLISASGLIDVNISLDGIMYRPLIMFNNHDQVDYSRSLVSNIQYNPSGTRYVLTLNHKYQWSNGQPITAQDVVFSYNIMRAASQPKAPWVYGGDGVGGLPTRWSSVTASGSDKVIVTLNTPSNQTWFIHNGLGQLVPLPVSVWNKDPHNMTKELQFIQSVANSPTNPVYKVVDGAYMMQSYQPNQNWTFVVNPKFGGHKAQIKKLIFQYETSDTAEFLGLKNGIISYGYLPQSEWNARRALSNDVLTASYHYGFNYVLVNQNAKAPGGLGPVFQQAYVRRALEMGVNQPGIIKNVFHGEAIPEGGPLGSRPATPYGNPAIAKPLFLYNPKAGKALLEAHGWHEVNGVMTKNGVKLSFSIDAAASGISGTDLMTLLKQGWAQEGIQVAINEQPFDTVFSEANQFDPTKWSMSYWPDGWTYDYPDWYPTGGALFSSAGASNFPGYSNPQMDALIKKSYEPGTTKQTQKALFAYQLYNAKQVPFIFLPWGADLIEHAKNLQGTHQGYNPIMQVLYPEYWHFSK